MLFVIKYRNLERRIYMKKNVYFPEKDVRMIVGNSGLMYYDGEEIYPFLKGKHFPFQKEVCYRLEEDQNYLMLESTNDHPMQAKIFTFPHQTRNIAFQDFFMNTETFSYEHIWDTILKIREMPVHLIVDLQTQKLDYYNMEDKGYLLMHIPSLEDLETMKKQKQKEYVEILNAFYENQENKQNYLEQKKQESYPFSIFTSRFYGFGNLPKLSVAITEDAYYLRFFDILQDKQTFLLSYKDFIYNKKKKNSFPKQKIYQKKYPKKEN